MDIPKKPVEELLIHEWLAIAVIIGFLLCLAIVTLFHGKTGIQLEVRSKASAFDVMVKGAVDHPGVYHLREEMPMKEVLAMAGVRQDSDLRRYALEGYVKKGRVIHVPQRKMLTIHLTGAVKGESPLEVPQGTKVQDLLNFVELADNADIEVLQKKRLLKPDETIHIPSLD